jgi:hypothetical protein
MELAKLHIQPQSPSALAAFDVLFNPNTYSVTKPVTWTQQAQTAGNPNETNRDLDAPPLVFGGGGSRTISLQLFFDVTEGPATDVRAETNKLVALTRIERDQERPPVVELSWGAASDGSDFPFIGVVTNLVQNFVLFRASGEPVRANVTVALTEYIDPEQNKRATDPELTTYVVKRGDSLSAIAAKLYRDPTRWRVIGA